jgi:acetylornithine deacetylase/succinyl-diaminopimelate desuccinylase family protein
VCLFAPDVIEQSTPWRCDVPSAADEVLKYIDAERLITLAQDMVRIPSDNPPGNEGALAKFLAQYLKRAGLETEMREVAPGRPNVLARWGTAKARPHLILNGHIDALPPGDGWTRDPYGGEIVNGRLYGRGSTDMKGPLASLIAALEAVKRSGATLRGSVTLEAVVDEEGTQEGTRRLVLEGVVGDFAIVAEPTEFLPVAAHKGDMYIEVVTHGREAHASTPQAGVNAIDQMADIIVELRDLAERLRQRIHPLVGHPTLTVGTIEGGLITPMVPGRCRITIDRRVLPNEVADEVVQEVREAVDRVRARRPDLRAEVRMMAFAPPMETDVTSPLATALRENTALILGRDPGIHGWAATCDANFLVNEGHTPTLVYGPGSIADQAHKPDESVSTEELVTAAKIYALTIMRLVG